jgi:hypothetical protein
MSRTERQHKLAEDRMRHRHLLAGVPPDWTAKCAPEEVNESPPEELDLEVRFRAIADAALRHAVVSQALEAELDRQSVIRARDYADLLPRDAAEVIRTAIGPIPTVDDPGRLSEVDQDEYRKFVAAALLADQLAKFEALSDEQETTRGSDHKHVIA